LERTAGQYATLLTCLDGGIRLMQPLMPFLAEELWRKLSDLGLVDPALAGLPIAACPAVGTYLSDAPYAGPEGNVAVP
jgi:valyl-tRNA synthetase